jgi:hypothetical protein
MNFKSKTMKISKILIFAGVLAAVFAACTKNELVTPDNFQVTTEKTTYSKTENVVFNISGSVDNIGFWSGEPGRVYDTRNDLIGSGALNRFVFTTTLANLPAGSTVGQTNNLTVLVSNNYNGKTDSASIRQATWNDVTSRGKLATNTTAVPSDTINVTDFATARDTMFVAFKYKSTASSNTSRARSWTMAKFTFQNKFPNGSVFTHATLETDNRLAGFNQYSYKGTSPKDSLTWSINTTNVFNAGVDNLSDEDWLISKPFKLSARNTDKAVGIKNNQTQLTQYTYKFAAAGTYKVTFVANNAGATAVKEVIRTLTITITN